MNKELTDVGFVADAIIAYMRHGHRPSEEEAGFLDRLPMIDALRQRAGQDDIAWLLGMVEEGSERVAGLAASILRYHIHRKEVRACFEARWDTGNSYLKSRLMWRILDDADLPQEWHRRFFDFVLAEWDTFREYNLSFYGPPSIALGNLLSRIGSPLSPDSKKWIYLCCVPCVIEDRGVAKTLITIGLSTGGLFTREVAEVLLKRFYLDENK